MYITGRAGQGVYYSVQGLQKERLTTGRSCLVRVEKESEMEGIRGIRMCIRYLVKNEKGATAIEYGLLAGLIAVVIIATVTALGGGLKAVFNTVCHGLATAANNSITCP